MSEKELRQKPSRRTWIPAWASLLVTVWPWPWPSSSLGLDFPAQWTGQHPQTHSLSVTSVSWHKVCLKSETGTVGLVVCTLFECPHYWGAQSLTEVIFLLKPPYFELNKTCLSQDHPRLAVEPSVPSTPPLTKLNETADLAERAQSLDKHLLGPYCVPSLGLGTRGTEVNKTEKVSGITGLLFHGEETDTNPRNPQEIQPLGQYSLGKSKDKKHPNNREHFEFIILITQFLNDVIV